MVEAIPAAQESASGAFLAAPPPFLSAEYHLRFLPRVIIHRLDEYRRRQRPPGFAAHVQLEIPLVIAACLLLMLLGLPPAMDHGSVGGWISAAIGAAALAALMTWSIVGEWRWRQEQGHRYGYAEFMPSLFFFCVVAGGSAGLIAGGVLSNDPKAGYLCSLPGLLAGYLAGPFAARWVHALGFMKTWFIYLAILALFLLPLEDLMVLFIYASKSSDPVWTGG